MLRLNDQYENHPYVDKFTKEHSVIFLYGRYVLEGEVDAKFYLDDICKLFQEDPCRQMINCMKAYNYLQKT